MLWFLLASVATIFGVLFLYIKNAGSRSYWEKRGVVCCEKSRGSFGAAMFRRKSTQEALWEIYNKHHEERYVGFYQMNEPILLIKDTDLIKQITTKNFEYFAHPQGHTTKLGKNFFALKDDTSSIDLLVFAPNKLEIFFDSISNSAENFASYFVKRTSNNIAMEMKDAFSRFSNDVLASCILGVTCSSLENKSNQLFITTRRAQVLNNGSNTRTFLWKTVKHAVKNRKPILSFLSENAKLNEDDLTAQVLVFYLGVFEMVSTLCSFMAYELAVNTGVQSKLLQEIDWALKDGGLTYGAVEKMKFLDMVVSEVLRKWPVKDRVEMVCRKPHALPNGSATLVVENGIKIVISCLAVQKDPKHFSDPDSFDPERFSDENRRKIKPFTYFPFGYLRNGSHVDSLFTLLTVKVLFCNLLAHFSLQVIEKTQVPLKLDRTSRTTLAGENGIWLGIKRRK